MRIVLCGRLPSRFKHPGGLEVIVVQLAKYFSEHGHEVTLYGKNIPPKSLIDFCEERKIRLGYVREVPAVFLYPYMFIKGFSFLRKIVKKCDIIHSHFGVFEFLAGLLIHGRCANIVTIHEIIQTQYRQNLIRKLGGHVENMLTRFADRKADSLIVHSQYMKKLVKNQWGFETKVIGHGIDTNLFKYLKGEDKVNNLWGDAKYRLLYVGRLDEQKGILDLVKSIQEMTKDNRFEDVKLCIIGEGELLPKIKQTVIKMQLKRNVLICRGVLHQQLPFLYSSANLTVVPSIYEGFGLVPLESLACGTPVVVGDNTGLKEIVTKEVAYFIPKIQPAAIAETIKNALSSELPSPKLCREYVLKNYTWDNIISQYEQIYRELLVRKRGL